MSVEDRQHFVAAVEAAHGRRLRRYLSARLRNAAADVPDLVQEIFLRLLRVERPESIRSPEAYLFTVAKHVLIQYRARRSAESELADMMDVLAELEHLPGTGAEAPLEAQQRMVEIQAVLAKLPKNAYVTLILHRVKGMTLAQIAQHLGVSRSMAKKYLVKALTQCQQLDDQV